MATTELPIRPRPAADPEAAVATVSPPLPVELEKFPECYPAVNPMDVYRSHITTLMHGVTGVEPAIIYRAIQWTQSLDKGDMILAAPALRIKGKKPAELAEEWAAKVPCLIPALHSSMLFLPLH